MFRTSGAAPGALGSAGLAWSFDCIFQGGGPGTATNTGVAMPEGFQVNAAVQHYWTPGLRTSVFGGYAELDFGDPASAGSAANLFCTGLTASANGGPIPVGTAAFGGAVRLNPGNNGGVC